MAIQKDSQVTTWLSKLPIFDYQDVLSLSNGESSYSIHCLSPDVRVLLLNLLVWYIDWKSTWVNFPDELTRADLLARAIYEVANQMACSEDIALVIQHLAAISLTQTEIRDNLGAVNTTLASELGEVNSSLATLITSVDGAFPSALIDDIEEILDGVGTILGAAAILP